MSDLQSAGRKALAAAPQPLQRALSGINVQFRGENGPTQSIASGSQSGNLAGVLEHDPSTINVMDQASFRKAPEQLATHEGTHLWQNNLPPSTQKAIPADNPADPYNYGGDKAIAKLLDSGKGLVNMPREQAAAAMQYGQSQGMPKLYQRLANTMNDVPLSQIDMTAPDAKGLNMHPRAPKPPAMMPAQDTYAKGQPAPGDDLPPGWSTTPPSGGGDDLPAGWSTTPPPPAAPTVLERVQLGAKNLGIGGAKGAGSTAAGIDDAVAKIPYIGKWLTTPLVGDKTSAQARTDLHNSTEAQGTMQSIGKGLEQAGEFLLPGGAEDKAATWMAEHAPQLGRAAAPLSKIAASALSSGAVNKAQGGSATAGALAGAGGSAIGQGLKAVAPQVMESALNIRKLDRAYGKTPGKAALAETTGFSPASTAQSAQSVLDRLNPELDAAADRASVKQRPRIAGLLPAPAEDIPLHKAPDIAGRPSRPVVLEQPDRPMARMLPADTGMRDLPSSSHTQIFPDQLPQGTARISPASPEPISGDASGLRAAQYIGQIPGERGGPGQVQGVLRRTPEPGRGPIPTTEPNRTASLGPARGELVRALDKATRQGERTTATQLQPMAAHLGETMSGEPIPNSVTPRQLLDLKRGFGNEFIHRWNPETMDGVKGTAANTYHQMAQELNRAVPEAQELNGRIGNLIPVAKRGASTELNAPTGQRIPNRFGAHTGALVGGGLGAQQGYQHGGVGGAVVGGLGGVLLPEMAASPTGQVILARLLHSGGPPLTKALTAGALQAFRSRSRDEEGNH